jgi:hypothetical protein
MTEVSHPSNRPPVVVLELDVRDASVLLAELLAMTRGPVPIPETQEGTRHWRVAHVQSRLTEALRRWPDA